MRAEFTKAEIEDMRTNPRVLRALADQHDVYATMADAIGDKVYIRCVNVHSERAKELRDLADKIEALW